MLRTTFLGLIFSLTTLLPSIEIYAQSAEEKGKQIALNSINKSNNFRDISSIIEMTTIETSGKKSVREMNVKALNIDNKSTIMSLLVFSKPKREKGVALLSHAFKTKQDKQWLYLPNIRRTKKLAPKGRKGSFMGSELSYSDLIPQSVEDFNYRYLKDGIVNQRNCSIVERTPKSRDSLYSKQITWFDKENLVGLKTEFYTLKSKPVKTLFTTEIITDNHGNSRPGLLVMKNHKTGRSTQLRNLDYQINTGLQEDEFSETALEFSR